MAKAQTPNGTSNGNRVRTALRCGAAVFIASLALAGCREDEQGRVLWYEQGTYKGDRVGQPMSESDLAELRARTAQQGGVGFGGGLSGVSGGSRSAGSNVRPPEPEPEKAHQ